MPSKNSSQDMLLSSPTMVGAEGEYVVFVIVAVVVAFLFFITLFQLRICGMLESQDDPIQQCTIDTLFWAA